MNEAAERNPRERVVVTGMGALTPAGNTVSETWEALKAGRSGIVPLTAFDTSPWPCRIAGVIKGFDPRQHLSRDALRTTSTATQLALVTAAQALADSGLDLDAEDRDEIGVVLGTAGGSTVEETEDGTRALLAQDGRRTSPMRVVRMWPNMAATFIAQAYHLRGFSSTVCTACAAGTQAIGEAADVIRRGKAEVVITGGTDSMASPLILAGFCAMHALATSYNDQPEKAMRPFDARREGFVAAQGSASLILESLRHAQARGAHIYAEVLGFGVSTDGFHIAEPDPQGSGAALAMRRALRSAGIAPDQVDYINAHGTSTPLGDAAESLAINSVFGQRASRVPVSSTKSMLGHAMGAAGAIEAVVSVMTLREGVIHPTINYETPDPGCDLDVVPNVARQADVQVVMSNSFGLGGQNAVIVLGALASDA